jgi:hypothetical protein
MLTAPLLALTLALPPAECLGSPALAHPPAATSDSLVALYERGRTWQQFADSVKARRQTWLDNYATGAPDGAAVARASLVPGRWRFLVVAIDACGDSANTIPYLARLVEAVPSLELRIVLPSEGQWVQEIHRTEDGRAATPTVVLLDEQGMERGCWIERPYVLRKLVAEVRAGTVAGNLVEVITAWRTEDRGRSTVSDLVDLLEAAAAGTARCP